MALAITNSFVAHTTARAADVNQNFQDVQTWANNLGVGQSFTPTWTATGGGASIGNGTLTGRYWEIGDLIIAHYYLAMGSTSNQGSSGVWEFTFPVAQDTSSQIWVGYGSDFDSGVANPKAVTAHPQSNTLIRVYLYDGSAIGVGSPHTWATGDILKFTVIYKKA